MADQTHGSTLLSLMSKKLPDEKEKPGGLHPSELSAEERQQLLADLDELNRMLPDPEEAEHLRAAVQNVLRRYGQTP